MKTNSSPNHAFDIELAQEIGVEQAIFLSNIQHWIIQNRANKRNFHEGRTWTYNSIKAFQEIFPYWTEKTIRRIADKLVESKILTTGNFNKDNRDRTLWYSFTNESEWVPAAEEHLPKQSNAFAQTGKSHICPNGQMTNSTDTDTDTYKTIGLGPVAIAPELLDQASKIYEAYPKKIGRPVAIKAILKALIKTDFLKLLSATETYSSSAQSQDRKFIPYPATWFNQERYNDPPEPKRGERVYGDTF